MKKSILSITILLVLFSCVHLFGQQNKKAQKARTNVSKAKKELTVAKQDSADDYQKYKNEADIAIAENQKKISELKVQQTLEAKENKEKYDQKVLALEQKNIALKQKLDGSGSVKTTMWSSFKREFSHDLSELGHAIKDIGVNNAK